MPHILRGGATADKFGSVEVSETRSLWARRLAGVMYGMCAALSRTAGMSERMLQHFIEPHSGVRSPWEEVRDLTLAMRSNRIAGGEALLADLCDELGYGLAPKLPIESLTSIAISEQAVRTHKELSEATSAALVAARSGDVGEYKRQSMEAAQALRALDGLVAANTTGEKP